MKTHNQIFSDPILNKLHEQVVNQFGDISKLQPVTPEFYFGQLAESIVGQQLSTKVADVIIERVKVTIGGTWDHTIISTIELEKLRAAGLSNAKAQYIKNIAEAWMNGTIIPEELSLLSDEELITKLVTIKGVGRWTAEMFLIFTLNRQDVFSVGDYGLRKAISQTYNIPITTKPAEFLEITKKWQPNRSLASRLLWKSLDLPKAIPKMAPVR